MNCVNCYHYQACASVDVTGYVTDREKGPEDVCDYFLSPEDVNPVAYWVRKVRKYKWSKNVRGQYECSRCNAACERVYTHDIMPVTLWNEYLADHWMPESGLPQFCSNCGAAMDLDRTDHTNTVIID